MFLENIYLINFKLLVSFSFVHIIYLKTNCLVNLTRTSKRNEPQRKTTPLYMLNLLQNNIKLLILPLLKVITHLIMYDKYQQR